MLWKGGNNLGSCQHFPTSISVYQIWGKMRSNCFDLHGWVIWGRRSPPILLGICTSSFINCPLPTFVHLSLFTNLKKNFMCHQYCSFLNICKHLPHSAIFLLICSGKKLAQWLTVTMCFLPLGNLGQVLPLWAAILSSYKMSLKSYLTHGAVERESA